MNTFKFIRKNLLFYRKNHLTVILGVMVSSGILLGALVLGDSVRYSLQNLVNTRLGKTEFALNSGDRFFRTNLASDLSKELATPVVAILQTRGMAIVQGGQKKTNRVQILGVGGDFGNLGEAREIYANLSFNEAVVNEAIARNLNLKIGDEFLLRFEKLDFLPKDAPLSLDSDLTLTHRFTVKTITDGSDLGNFNLKSNQITPNNVFISLPFLAEEMDLPQRANILLVAERPERALEIAEINSALQKNWTLQDIGLKIISNRNQNFVEIRSDRIFLDTPVVNACKKLKGNQQIFTYFVNELRLGTKSTPYSFVTGADQSVFGENLGNQDIIINKWLAEDLQGKVGKEIELFYYILGQKRELIEKRSSFRIKKIVPILGIFADRELMPDFPGLAGEENCRDWEPGIPLNLDKIREKDEIYWDDYRGTPKAFVSLGSAQKLWSNRFGDVTSIRIPHSTPGDVESIIKKSIEPASFGFIFQPVKDQGLRASKESVDFAQLFIGLSFFIIIAALLLTGLLFIFSLEQRSTENGLLLAVGFPVKSVKRIVYSEAVVIVVIGSVLGIGFGILYNQLILAAIKTIWVDIVGTSAIQLHLKLNSILLGFLGGICMAFFTIWMLLRRQLKKSISTLQRENLGLNMQKDPKRPWLSWVIACTGLVLAIVIILSTSPGRGREATGSFFAAGALLLISGIFFAYTFIYKFNEKVEKSQLSLLTIGIRNNLRRKFRSISLMGLLACGIFIVFTVGANRNSAVQDADKRTSGTGGFALWGECSLPVLYDLNSPKGQEFYGLDPDTCLEADFVQFRVREGDDASCLNLNRITNPQLIGTNPEELNKRNAFTFVEFSPDLNDKNPWLFLDTKISEDVIPGIADQTVIIWGLGKSIGDTIEYIAENGHPFQIKLIGALANSVFQGNIIVSEKFLLEKYPSLSGYKLLLIDAPSARVKPLHDHLSWVLQDLGIDLQSTAFRLDGFNKVENTYLSIFLILGGLGMMLGSVGIGIVVLRNVMERRGELALLKAVGFEHNDIHKLIFYEHLTIFIIGLCIGLFAAIIAVLPALKTPGINVPYLTMILLSLGIILSGLFWTFFATQISTRGELLPALRNE